MDLAIVYIGFAQAVFAALVMFLKRPLKIADVILALWLLSMSGIFGLNILELLEKVEQNMWVVSLSLSMTFPPFLYLYSKYVTVDFERFRWTDLLHFIPVLLLIHVFLIFKAIAYDPGSTENVFTQLNWIRNSFGTLFIVLIWVYGIMAIVNVIRYKRQIQNNYSYESDRISLNWLLLVVVSFLVLYFLIIFLSNLIEKQVELPWIDLARNALTLVYVYVLSIWGFRQHQLTSDTPHIRLNTKIRKKNETGSGKYRKSGLKSDQAAEYQNKLIRFMNQTEAWRDAELSVAKLAVQTNIPKHHITQVLNENLGKNFYVFVNEYRTEYAKKLIVSPEYESWSFVAIAYECGFNSKTAFNNFFKKHTGKTPSEYKKTKLG